ncbi:hypothetical protein KP509_32G014000 [Ceratopteris richardii]|uniref:Retrovirus-related Pol polyprotein from transposon TNT 1-94-like beta-barrel domain-containing protein n=1 Tax=Ceratopteris richardii TaxID=49495 RepID=A0A8T2QRJ8_CERRI|nr:hypothetical protein KP509_32G014000 [Ceratopteris richardii]
MLPGTNVHTPNGKGYVETGDVTTHEISHVGDVALDDKEERRCFKNVLHVPTIIKNLVAAGKMVEIGSKVRFNKGGCFVENPKQGYKVIARGRKPGSLFTLEVNSHSIQHMYFTY